MNMAPKEATQEDYTVMAKHFPYFLEDKDHLIWWVLLGKKQLRLLQLGRINERGKQFPVIN